MHSIRSAFLLLLGILLIFAVSTAVYLGRGQPPIEQGTNVSSASSESAIEGSTEQALVVPDVFVNQSPTNRTLTVPEGYTVSVFAAGLGKARFFDVADDGTVYLTDLNGRVLAIRDDNDDNVADTIATVDSNLRSPHGIDWFGDDLYIGEEDQVVVYRSVKPDGSFDRKDVLVSGLPAGEGHFTRTVQIGPDGKLYVSVGSSCNLCEETDPRRAAIVRYNPDGTGEEVFATGLRNSVGFVFSAGKIWATENGRDRIGDNIPPEEINIVEQGKHYGWPYCHGDSDTGPEFPDRSEFCRTEIQKPQYKFQAHSAPLGLTFVPSGTTFPNAMRNALFVALHGSWNRTDPTGYKVITFDTSDQNPDAKDFIFGWLLADGSSWGRPVGVGFSKNGSLLISDDKAGVLYNVRFPK